jgi:hypothetical protein
MAAFSLSPISEANLKTGNPAALRQQMKTFEDTTTNHGPEHTSEMAKLAATFNGVPSNRQETSSWVKHIAVMTIMILGNMCPLNPHLDRLVTTLAQAKLFVGWRFALPD